jgi:alpha-L-arabinofuranosidase
MIDKVKVFVAVVIAFFLIAGFAGTFPTSASPASVTVNATNVIKTIPPYLYGVDVAAWHETIYDKGTLRSIVPQRLQEAGITWLDYPGGAYSNTFVWNATNLPTEMNTDQFIALCRAIGAEPRIAVNLNEPVELATAWVRYCNIEHNYSVKYWQLHNEPWYDGMKGSAYAAKINEFAPAMKAVDPTIKIGACISCRYPSEKSNTETVIKNAWQNIDVLNHNAYFISPTAYSYDQRQQYYDSLLYDTTGDTSPNLSLKLWLASLRSLWQKYAGSKPVEYHVGSYNSISYYPADWQVNFLPEGLWVAHILGVMMTDQVDRACFWCFLNPYPPKQGDYGMISPTFEPYVTHDAYNLVTHHFGDTLVSCTSDTVDLAAYASTSGGGNKLHIMLINKKPDLDIPTTFTLQNFNPQSTATATILDGPTEPASVFDYSLRTETISGVASTFTWTVPSYSAVVIEITKSGALTGSAASEPASLGSADVGTTDAGTLATNIALGKPTYASSSALKEQCKYYHCEDFNTSKAVDGDSTYTRWASKIWWETGDYPDVTEYFVVDLQSVTEFNKIVLKWCLWAATYDVLTSNDNSTWTKIADHTNAVRTKPAPQPIEEITFSPAKSARYIKVYMKTRPSGYEYLSTWTPNAFGLWEFEVYAEAAPPPPGVMHVASIDMSGTKTGQKWKAHATVTIVDNNNAPVSGATVYGSWSGAWTGDVSGVTGSDGKIKLSSGSVTGGGTFTFTVTNVVKTDWTYDPSKNVETSDTITLP